MVKNKVCSILIRYGIATLGLTLVALGVSLSILSNLGTSPISCLPYVLHLKGGLSVGQYTALMHLAFIILQIILLRKNFKLESLLQIAAAFVFGALTDFFIWATAWISVTAYIERLGLMLLAILFTAFGISVEVRAHAWMIAGEMTVAAIAQVANAKFRHVKIIFDTSLVAISAALALIFFNNPLGNGSETVIREGTLILALLTGTLMKATDPLANRLIGKIIDRNM